MTWLSTLFGNCGSHRGQLYKVWCSGCSWVVYTQSIPLSMIVIGGWPVVYYSSKWVVWDLNITSYILVVAVMNMRMNSLCVCVILFLTLREPGSFWNQYLWNQRPHRITWYNIELTFLDTSTITVVTCAFGWFHKQRIWWEAIQTVWRIVRLYLLLGPVFLVLGHCCRISWRKTPCPKSLRTEKSDPCVLESLCLIYAAWNPSNKHIMNNDY